MKDNLRRLDIINVNVNKREFVAVFIKRKKDGIWLLPIYNFEELGGVSNSKLFPGIIVKESSIATYHKLDEDQVFSLIYLLNVNNSWIKKAIDKALNE